VIFTRKSSGNHLLEANFHHSATSSWHECLAPSEPAALRNSNGAVIRISRAG
jgi:hypothetical protein